MLKSNTSKKSYDLRRFTAGNVEDLGHAIDDLKHRFDSMDKVAQRIVEFLYYSLQDEETGEKACALVRLFKTHPYKELDPDLQQAVRKITPEFDGRVETNCLTLLGTAGDEPAWNSRHVSVGHRAIGLTSPDMVRRAPMISNLFSQLGCDIDYVLKPDPKIFLTNPQTFNVFHVPDALGSELIPAQQHFVVPRGIKSVVGFGGTLPHGAVFAVILFLKIQIPQSVAELFGNLASDVRSKILPYETKVF